MRAMDSYPDQEPTSLTDSIAPAGDVSVDRQNSAMSCGDVVVGTVAATVQSWRTYPTVGCHNAPRTPAHVFLSPCVCVLVLLICPHVFVYLSS